MTFYSFLTILLGLIAINILGLVVLVDVSRDLLKRRRRRLKEEAEAEEAAAAVARA